MRDTIPAWVGGRLVPVDKLEVHTRGLRHPAVSVFLLDGDRTLIQRRALGKYHTPGLWANACCTHPAWGEEPAACALRRLREELGLRGRDLRWRDRIEYRAEVGDGLVEHEVVELFTAGADDRTQLSPDPAEVMEVRWVGLDALRGEVAEAPQPSRRGCGSTSPTTAAASSGGRREMPERNLARLIAALSPRLDPEPWVFVNMKKVPADVHPLMTFREEEGMTMILHPDEARRLGQPGGPAFRRITLGVNSSVEAVGLTAAVASTLTAIGISANIVAAYHHDHVFVPSDRAEDALACLARMKGPDQPA